ncbi:MAG: tetraacyldisaccharide 4'-kinase [Bryobacterales bacterium]
MAERLTLAGVEAPIGVGPDRHADGLARALPGGRVLARRWLFRTMPSRGISISCHRREQALCEEPLPLGRRREPFSALGRAGAFLLTRTKPGCEYEALARRLTRNASGAPVFRSRVIPTQLRSAGRVPEAALEPQALSGRKVAAFCGLGNPGGFFTTLEGAGADLVARMEFRDHHRYSLDDWWRIAAEAREAGAELLVTTEKDIVNLAAEVPPEMRTGAPSLYALTIELEIDEEGVLLDWIERRIEESKR